MRKILFALFSLALLCACSSKESGIEYIPVEVSLTLADSHSLIADGAEFALVATCTRAGKNQVPMTKNEVARYIASVNNGVVALSAASENDRLYANYGDRNILYSVVYPYSEQEYEAPQNQTFPQTIEQRICGSVQLDSPYSTTVISVKPEPRAAVLSIEIPSNFVASKAVVLKDLSVLGVEVNFEDGLVLDKNRTVDVAVPQSTIEEEGLPVVVNTIDGQTYTVPMLVGVDSGTTLENGKTYKVYLPSADSFLPCSFPVVFPLGSDPKSRIGHYCNHDEQPEWFNRGIWRCYSQRQVYARWVKVSDPDSRFAQLREILGKVGGITYGSVGLKGIWTGDYFEFTFPVSHLDAGTQVSFEAPFYGRQQPVFWGVEWQENGEWKNNYRPITSYDGTVTLSASFALKYHGVVVKDSFTLGSAIDNDYLRVRIKCVDGSYQAGATGVVKRELPYVEGGAYFSPFYFYCADSGVGAFTWKINN